MLNVGQFISWKNYTYENKIALPIQVPYKHNELNTKPDAYKSINASQLQTNKPAK
jgi:hypothetical protein